MTTATLEKQPSSAGQPAAPALPAQMKPPKTNSILVGFDFGTNKSCLLAGLPGSTDIAVSKVIPSVVGYAKEARR